MEKIMKINVGITEEKRSQIADGLAKVLADSYTLYLKTHNFHWNVTGPMFTNLHQLFEQQYSELATAVDSIAERIRSLGFPAPGSYAQFLKLTSIKEEIHVPHAKDMIKQLIEGHETVIRTIRVLIPLISENLDEASLDLLTERLEVHEKAGWMLRSLLEE